MKTEHPQMALLFSRAIQFLVTFNNQIAITVAFL